MMKKTLLNIFHTFFGISLILGCWTGFAWLGKHFVSVESVLPMAMLGMTIGGFLAVWYWVRFPR